MTEQVSASASTCCQADKITPNGAASWDIEAGPIWLDTASDGAVAMLGGFTDSRYFGFFQAVGYNGFDRSETGLPSTDIPRMQGFMALELKRRGAAALRSRLYRLGPLYPRGLHGRNRDG